MDTSPLAKFLYIASPEKCLSVLFPQLPNLYLGEWKARYGALFDDVHITYVVAMRRPSPGPVADVFHRPIHDLQLPRLVGAH